MYRHLLVPIDDTDLSVQGIGNAVALARQLGARITFFHALGEDASLRGEADVLRLPACDEYDHAFAGKARELFARAEAAARALGVSCDSRHVINDKPAQAIIDAARSAACDLIFVASHDHRGRPGGLFSSDTVSALMNAGVPVLVSATGESAIPARAIGIIRDEHRSLAAVMHAWMHALAGARQAGTAADPGLMRAIVRYVQRSPMRLQQPAEEEQLFRRLRERTTSCHAELDELEHQRRRGAQLVAALALHVDHLAAADSDTQVALTRALEDEVNRYAQFLWDHLGREDGVVLAAAQQHLKAEDWAEIDAAFAENRAPRSGDAEREYRRLFSRIVDPLPA